MIEIQTKLLHSRKDDVWVKIVQTVVKGPDSLLDRRISLIIPTPREAVEFAVRILKELVPAACLKSAAEDLKRIADTAAKAANKEGT